MRITNPAATRTLGYSGSGSDGTRTTGKPEQSSCCSGMCSAQGWDSRSESEGAMTVASSPRRCRWARTLRTELVTPVIWGKNDSATTTTFTPSLLRHRVAGCRRAGAFWVNGS